MCGLPPTGNGDCPAAVCLASAIPGTGKFTGPPEPNQVLDRLLLGSKLGQTPAAQPSIPLRSAGRHCLARTRPRRVTRWLAASIIAPPAPALFSAGDDSSPSRYFRPQNRGAVPEGPRGETRHTRAESARARRLALGNRNGHGSRLHKISRPHIRRVLPFERLASRRHGSR